jgi:predicted amidohydrolase YtcJ
VSNPPGGSPPPDALVIVNARLRTGDPRRPWADAAIVEGDRVVFAGPSAEAMKRLPPGVTPLNARGAELAADAVALRAFAARVGG